MTDITLEPGSVTETEHEDVPVEAPEPDEPESPDNDEVPE